MTEPRQENSGWRALREHWRSHKLSFLIAGSIVTLVGLHLSLNAVPDVYEVEAVLTVETSGRILSGHGAEIKSPRILAVVAERMGKFTPDASPTSRQNAVREVERVLSVVEVPPAMTGETEIRLSGRGTRREELPTLVNLVAETWVADAASRSRQAREKTDALGTDLAKATERYNETSALLGDANKALDEFKTKHVDLGGDPEAVLRKITDEQKAAATELDKARSEVAGLEAAEERLRASLASVEPFVETKDVTTVRDPERVALEQEIRMMQRQLDDMLRMYTRKHPEVIALETNLLLKNRELKQLNERVQDSVTSSKRPNPEYAVLKGKLDDTVVKLEITRSHVTNLQSRLKSLSEGTDDLRKLATSFRTLQNELVDLQKRHDEQKEEVKTRKEALDAAAAAVRAVPKIHTLATTPTVPVGPRRSFYFAGVALVAVVVGRIAMSAAFHASRRFASAYEVRRLTGLPVTTTISPVAGTEAAHQRRRRRLVKGVVFLSILAITVIAAWVMLSASAPALGMGG